MSGLSTGGGDFAAKGGDAQSGVRSSVGFSVGNFNASRQQFSPMMIGGIVVTVIFVSALVFKGGKKK